MKKSMQKLASRNLLKRIFTSATEQIQLAGFQSRIKSVLDVFQVVSICYNVVTKISET